MAWKKPIFTDFFPWSTRKTLKAYHRKHKAEEELKKGMNIEKRSHI